MIETPSNVLIDYENMAKKKKKNLKLSFFKYSYFLTYQHCFLDRNLIINGVVPDIKNEIAINWLR